MPGAGVLEGFGAGSEASGRPRPPRWKKNRAVAGRRRDEEEQRKEKNGRRKGMTCGVSMSVSGEREDYNRGILVYTIIRTSARGPKVIENVENGMFEGTNEL